MREELEMIMTDITGRDFSNADENMSLFSSVLGMKARDILYFFLEIEKKYGIIFDAEKINDPQFYTFKAISTALMAEKKEMKDISN